MFSSQTLPPDDLNINGLGAITINGMTSIIININDMATWLYQRSNITNIDGWVRLGTNYTPDHSDPYLSFTSIYKDLSTYNTDTDSPQYYTVSDVEKFVWNEIKPFSLVLETTPYELGQTKLAVDFQADITFTQDGDYMVVSYYGAEDMLPLTFYGPEAVIIQTTGENATLENTCNIVKSGKFEWVVDGTNYKLKGKLPLATDDNNLAYSIALPFSQELITMPAHVLTQSGDTLYTKKKIPKVYIQYQNTASFNLNGEEMPLNHLYTTGDEKGVDGETGTDLHTGILMRATMFRGWNRAVFAEITNNSGSSMTILGVSVVLNA